MRELVEPSDALCCLSPATFDGKQHLLSLPVVNSVGYVLRFLKKLCRSLHCENLFSDQPITQHNGSSYQTDNMPLSGGYTGHAHQLNKEFISYSVVP